MEGRKEGREEIEGEGEEERGKEVERDGGWRREEGMDEGWHMGLREEV